MIKKVAFELPNVQRISDSGWTGKNKELSSESRARPQGLHRQTAFPGGGGRGTGRHSGEGRHWRLLLSPSWSPVVRLPG